MTKGSGQAGKGPITRRQVLKTVPATMAAAGLAIVAARESEAANKVPKNAVNYQDSPMDGKRCADCTFFEQGGTCTKVEGEISPDGWCALWAPKQG